MTDQTSCCVDDGLESVQELCRKADQQRITVIKLLQHKTGDEWHDSLMMQWRLDAPQLAQDAETACRCSEMCVIMDASASRSRWTPRCWTKLTGVTSSAPTRSGNNYELMCLLLTDVGRIHAFSVSSLKPPYKGGLLLCIVCKIFFLFLQTTYVAAETIYH